MIIDNVFIISKRQSSLSNKFYNRNERCRSDFQYCWHWLNWLASSASILHSDSLHLRLNVIVASLCSIDSWWLFSVLPVADSFSNKEMSTVSRIRVHTRETINTSLWRRKAKSASSNDFGVVVLAPNKICGTFPWRVSVFSVLWNIMF